MMGANELTTGPERARPGGPRLLELGAIVVGFSLAALALRVCWPKGLIPSTTDLAAGVVVYVWLGLAASGPFVLLLGRHQRRGPRGAVVPYSSAEKAWLLIGGYWIMILVAAALLVSIFPIVGLVPIVVAALSWLIAPRPPRLSANERPWTHRVALLVLWTWPVAWVAMVILTESVF